MKNIMDLASFRESKLISHIMNFSQDLEGAIVTW